MVSDLQKAYQLVNETLNLGKSVDELAKSTLVASMIYANKPGDGSAREQAASCQRVLGGGANIALEYATKRYRSNVINWGMFPFVTSETDSRKLAVGDYVFIPDVKSILLSADDSFKAYVINDGKKKKLYCI